MKARLITILILSISSISISSHAHTSGNSFSKSYSQDILFSHISTNEGLKLSKEIEAEDYIEISSKEQKNLNNILHSCLKILKKKHDTISNEKEFKCVIN